jgi:hypothetical protein
MSGSRAASVISSTLVVRVVRVAFEKRRFLRRRRRVHQARVARIDINTKAPIAMPAMAPAPKLLPAALEVLSVA